MKLGINLAKWLQKSLKFRTPNSYQRQKVDNKIHLFNYDYASLEKLMLTGTPFKSGIKIKTDSGLVYHVHIVSKCLENISEANWIVCLHFPAEPHLIDYLMDLLSILKSKPNIQKYLNR